MVTIRSSAVTRLSFDFIATPGAYAAGSATSRDAIVANFKLLDQDQSSNSHRACAANEFAMQP